MDLSFEKEKNIKAISITGAITIVLFLIFFYVHYEKPIPPEPIIGEGIEVNLGNSETGYGEIPPKAPGESAEKVASKSAPINQPISQPIQPIENPSEDDIDVNNKKPTKAINKPLVESKPIPAPTPKAIFKANNTKGPGGNNADSYNGVRNQGIAGGKGDQGNPNGNPNSDSYTGNAASGRAGTGGVAIKSGSGLDGRRITKLPAFEDDFNENAKVAVDITVDQTGNVIAAIINPKGTTTTNSNIRNIALRKARTLKLNAAASEEQTGTLVFEFKLRN
jgi:hypothetical protein